MMGFLNNRRNARIITALVVLLSVALSFIVSAVQVNYDPISTNAATKWAKKNYRDFRQFVSDEAGLLSSAEEQTVEKYLAQLSYGNGFQFAVVTVKQVSGTMEEAANAKYARAPFSQCDGLLLIDAESGEWYAVFGPGFGQYDEQSLYELFSRMLGSRIEPKRAGRTAAEFLRALTGWFDEQGIYTQDFGQQQKRRGLVKPLAILVIAIIVLLDVFGH